MRSHSRFLVVHPLGDTDPSNLPVTDILMAVSFYTEELGFDLEDLYGEPPTEASLTRDHVMLRLVVTDRGPEEASCYIEVSDVDAVLDEYQKRGVIVAGGPQVIEAGSQRYRGFFVRDPDGICLCVGSHLGPPLEITHASAVTICVSDQQKSLDFYVYALGFETRHDAPRGLDARWIEVAPPGARTGVILYAPPDRKTRIGSDTGIVWSCDDISATYAALCARGVDFLAPPSEEPWGKVAHFRDPDGNTSQLVETL